MCDGENQGTNPLWWVGVLLSIVGSVISNLGVNMQKYSMMQESKRSKEEQRGYAGQPLWFVGLGGVIFGALFDFAALGFIAQSLATPIGSVTMVANIVFAHFWLGEALTKADLVATGAIIFGAIIVAAFADKTETCYTIDELLDLYLKPGFIAYAVAVAIFSISMYSGIRLIERESKKLKRSKSAFERKWAGVHAFCYAALSGTLGAQNVLFAKSVGEMLKTSFKGDNQMVNPLTYALIICMLASIFTQTHFLAKGLSHFDALYIVPVFQCFFIMVSIIGGGIFFSEFARLSLLQGICFGIGVVITLIGVKKLSQREMCNLKPFERLIKVKTAITAVVRMQKAALGKVLAFEHGGVCDEEDKEDKELNPIADTAPGIEIALKEDREPEQQVPDCAGSVLDLDEELGQQDGQPMSPDELAAAVVIGLSGGVSFFQVNPVKDDKNEDSDSEMSMDVSIQDDMSPDRGAAVGDGLPTSFVFDFQRGRPLDESTAPVRTIVDDNHSVIGTMNGDGTVDL
eukprot:TRINITY_DN1742_c0_g1_i13.p1 TRINITY_DN1742_c0_g1~~TRINITY_DN1742_c0_g1_i13.p1  ORF type:complete len:515 (+),score=141.73 TRINITY_DN1742_c0_g1_i13:209-1753(+)